MRVPCSLCGSVACQVQSPTVCRTLRRLRQPAPVVMAAPDVEEPTELGEPAEPDLAQVAELTDETGDPGDQVPDPPADEPAPTRPRRGRQPR